MATIRVIGQVTLEYVNKFPNTSTLSLARMLYRDNAPLFINVEHARRMVRYYRGACGDKDRKKQKLGKYAEQI
jgi:hypothetical protein